MEDINEQETTKDARGASELKRLLGVRPPIRKPWHLKHWFWRIWTTERFNCGISVNHSYGNYGFRKLWLGIYWQWGWYNSKEEKYT